MRTHHKVCGNCSKLLSYIVKILLPNKAMVNWPINQLYPLELLNIPLEDTDSSIESHQLLFIIYSYDWEML